jgi:hypothetical protein
VGLLVAGAPAPSAAQLFLASRPHPEFRIGPLFVRAGITPALGPVTLDVLWSLEIPPTRSALDVEQDLYLLWPGAVDGLRSDGPPDPALTRYVESRGFTALSEGRLPLFAESLYRRNGESPPEPVGGGAPFVSFVQTSGPHGLTAPATFIRIPWTPRLANRTWLIDLRMRVSDLVKPRKSNWVENAFRGPRYIFTVSYHDVRAPAVFPLYLEHRDRVVRLADAPAELVVNFADADHLRIDEVFPPSSVKRLSETLESTEVVSFFLEKTDGIAPQQLTIQFGYFSGLRAWAPILIPVLFFVLGNVAAVVLRHVAGRAVQLLSARVQVGRWNEKTPRRRSGVILSRDMVAQIVPGETTYDDVIRLCGPEAEHREDLAAPGRRTLVYHGRLQVPHRRRTFGWLATVSHWDVEDHTTQIEIDHDRVRDVQAQVRRSRVVAPEPPPPP